MDIPNKNSKLFTISLTVIVITGVFLLYYFFLRPEPSNDLVGEGVGAEDVSGEPIDPFDVDTETLSSEAGRSFLTLLNEVRSISLEAPFLEESRFTNLTDFTYTLPEGEVGRENPFTPVGNIQSLLSEEG